MPAVTPVLPLNSKSGRGDWIRTSDPLRPRQVRYQAALRPDSENPLILLHSPTAHVTFASLFGLNLYQNCTKPQPACPKTPAPSFAVRLSFCRASRFICSFICEYFLNTFASSCRRS